MVYSEADSLIIEKALICREKGNYKEALDKLHSLEMTYVNDSVFNGIVATVYYKMKDFENSEKYFRIASILNPQSELSSLALFHCLFNQNKTLQGLHEILRFISSNKYELYKTTILELKSNFDSFNNQEKEVINKL